MTANETSIWNLKKQIIQIFWSTRIQSCTFTVFKLNNVFELFRFNEFFEFNKLCELNNNHVKDMQSSFSVVNMTDSKSQEKMN